MFQSAHIPFPRPNPFVGAINHPDLYLWDAWTCTAAGSVHVYCLALARELNGTLIQPNERNLYQFHIRHFESGDAGKTWLDKGAYLAPPAAPNRNIWSGSILPLNDEVLVAHTETRWAEEERPFVQSICVGSGTSLNEYNGLPFSVISDPERDHHEILRKGYFLSNLGSLGCAEGEDGGPILAWRDPFLFNDAETIHVLWSAKVGPRTPAIAHAKLKPIKNGTFECELCAPIILPDANEYTQAELPKIWRDDTDGGFCLMVSACDRSHEKQPDSEVNKQMRLYKSFDITGPWRIWSPETSILPMPDHTFGASPYSWDDSKKEIQVVAPVTEQGSYDKKLSMDTGVVVSLRTPDTVLR